MHRQIYGYPTWDESRGWLIFHVTFKPSSTSLCQTRVSVLSCSVYQRRCMGGRVASHQTLGSSAWKNICLSNNPVICVWLNNGGGGSSTAEKCSSLSVCRLTTHNLCHPLSYFEVFSFQQQGEKMGKVVSLVWDLSPLSFLVLFHGLVVSG